MSHATQNAPYKLLYTESMSPYDWGAWNIGESTLFELGSLVNGVIQATGAQNEACYRRGEGVDSSLVSADEAVFSAMRVDNDKWEVEALLGPQLTGVYPRLLRYQVGADLIYTPGEIRYPFFAVDCLERHLYQRIDHHDNPDLPPLFRPFLARAAFVTLFRSVRKLTDEFPTNKEHWEIR